MNKALWVIAVCEVIRALQNLFQLWISYSNNSKYMKKATDEFVKSLNKTDEEVWKSVFKETPVYSEKENNNGRV